MQKSLFKGITDNLWSYSVFRNTILLNESWLWLSASPISLQYICHRSSLHPATEKNDKSLTKFFFLSRRKVLYKMTGSLHTICSLDCSLEGLLQKKKKSAHWICTQMGSFHRPPLLMQCSRAILVFTTGFKMGSIINIPKHPLTMHFLSSTPDRSSSNSLPT